MIDAATRRFIDGHRQCDVHQLALKAGAYGEVDMAVAVEQIAGWQKARQKIPSWAACDEIVYPAHLSMEQCSSEQTACYKQHLSRRLLNELADCNHTSMTDLTGGFGVDFAFLCSLFEKGIYVERQPSLCAVVRHNFKALGLRQAEVVEGDSSDILNTLPHQQLIFVDPARRDNHGDRTFAITDCTPDVLQMLPQLLHKADIVLLKLSPMLDWHHTAESLNAICAGSVREIHIVASGNECKELLVVLTATPYDKPLGIHCVNDGNVIVFDDIPSPSLPVIDNSGSLQGKHLYEPNASVMKSGFFAAIAHRYKVVALDTNSHLFVSDTPIQDFPGRSFIIHDITSMNKRMVRQHLAEIRQANITVRNFPLSVAELRKRLRLGDGGDTYLFATTVQKQHLILVCEKE